MQVYVLRDFFLHQQFTLIHVVNFFRKYLIINISSLTLVVLLFYICLS